jgi:Ca2+/Na+ antiporter
MVDYLKGHEKFVKEALDKKEDFDWDWLRDYHKTQIEYMQHERLIHLMVTLAFALFFIVTILFAVSFEKPVILLVSLFVLVLLVPYIAHYFKLENGVQRWYELYKNIDENCRRKKSNL